MGRDQVNTEYEETLRKDGFRGREDLNNKDDSYIAFGSGDLWLIAACTPYISVICVLWAEDSIIQDVDTLFHYPEIAKKMPSNIQTQIQTLSHPQDLSNGVLSSAEPCTALSLFTPSLSPLACNERLIFTNGNLVCFGFLAKFDGARLSRCWRCWGVIELI